MARGNRREIIFRDDQDSKAFLERLEIACQRTGWQIHAFVLMRNHYHVVIHTPEPNLVEGMKWLQNAYTRYFNNVGRLDEWTLDEQSESAGARMGEIEGQTLHSTLQRGWYWGSEAFREWLVKKAGSRAVSNHDYRVSPLGRDYAEADAEAWISRGCDALGLDPATDILRSARHGDWRRTAIAWAIWKRASVSQDWIAERLGMKSRQNVSQQVRRFDKLPLRTLSKELREWKRKLIIVD